MRGYGFGEKIDEHSICYLLSSPWMFNFPYTLEGPCQVILEDCSVISTEIWDNFCQQIIDKYYKISGTCYLEIKRVGGILFSSTLLFNIVCLIMQKYLIRIEGFNIYEALGVTYKHTFKYAYGYCMYIYIQYILYIQYIFMYIYCMNFLYF